MSEFLQPLPPLLPRACCHGCFDALRVVPPCSLWPSRSRQPPRHTRAPLPRSPPCGRTVAQVFSHARAAPPRGGSAGGGGVRAEEPAPALQLLHRVRSRASGGTAATLARLLLALLLLARRPLPPRCEARQLGSAPPLAKAAPRRGRPAPAAEALRPAPRPNNTMRRRGKHVTAGARLPLLVDGGRHGGRPWSGKRGRPRARRERVALHREPVAL